MAHNGKGTQNNWPIGVNVSEEPASLTKRGNKVKDLLELDAPLNTDLFIVCPLYVQDPSLIAARLSPVASELEEHDVVHAFLNPHQEGAPFTNSIMPRRYARVRAGRSGAS
eukprot:7255926-Heterocapsa_arctica.AAC.2